MEINTPEESLVCGIGPCLSQTNNLYKVTQGVQEQNLSK